MDIGQRILKLRKERGLTQREVARRAGLSPSGVGFIELGQVKRPSAETVVAIARALGVPVEELLVEESTAPKAEGLQQEVARWLSDRSDHPVLEPYAAWAGRVAQLDLKGVRLEGYHLDTDADELRSEAREDARRIFPPTRGDARDYTALSRELRKQVRREHGRKVAALRRYMKYLEDREDRESDGVPEGEALALLLKAS